MIIFTFQEMMKNSNKIILYIKGIDESLDVLNFNIKQKNGYYAIDECNIEMFFSTHYSKLLYTFYENKQISKESEMFLQTPSEKYNCYSCYLTELSYNNQYIKLNIITYYLNKWSNVQNCPNWLFPHFRNESIDDLLENF